VSVDGPSLPAVAVFAVTMVSGPDWDPSRGRREQIGWVEHAAVMDRLVAERFVLLGGPVGDGQEVLLAVEAADEEDVRARLRVDPWVPGVLAVGSVRVWSVWLDGRAAGR
jgi:hypothetical protein